jgi:hypothetical protein
MIFFHDDCKDEIIETLLQGPMQLAELVSLVSQRKNTTPQSVYKMITYFIKSEILIKQKKVIMIDNLWISRIEKVTQIARSKNDVATLESFLHATNTKSVSFDFDSISSMNRFWANTVLKLSGIYAHTNVYIYNIHSWFYALLPKTEKQFFDILRKTSPTIYLSIHGTTTIDKGTIKTLKQRFHNVHINIGVRNLSYYKNYCTVVGDFVIYTHFKKDFLSAMASTLGTIASLNNSLPLAISELTKKQKVKISIVKNPNLAHKIRSSLGKDFQ